MAWVVVVVWLPGETERWDTHPLPRSMHHTPAPRCCTHMHAAQPKRPLPFTALSYDPAKTSQ